MRIRVTPSTVIMVVVIAVFAYPLLGGGAAAVLGAIACGLGVILGVLVHELAHAGVARAAGLKVIGIELNLFGGHTRFAGDATTVLWRIAISVAGPFSNLLLGTVLTAAGALALLPPRPALVIAYVGWMNLALGVFNLLPALPLDGGRVVQVLLARLTGSQTVSYRVTGWIGIVLGAAVLVVPALLAVTTGLGGVRLVSLWQIIVGLVLIGGSVQALQAAREYGRVDALDLTVLSRRAHAVTPAVPVGDVLAWVHGGTPVLVLDGRGAALVDPDAAASVPPQSRGTTPVAAVSRAVGRPLLMPWPIGNEQLVQAVVTHRPDLIVLDGGTAERRVLDPHDLGRALGTAR